MKSKRWIWLPFVAVIMLLLGVAEFWFGWIPKPRYSAEDFNIKTFTERQMLFREFQFLIYEHCIYI